MAMQAGNFSSSDFSDRQTFSDAAVVSTVEAKTYIRVPHKQSLGPLRRLRRALFGSLLSPIYWLLAYRYRVPGLRFRGECALLAIRLLFGSKARVAFSDVYSLFVWPLDSVRYFEFDFMWEALSGLSIRHYLDVSSPRLLPIMLTLKRKQLRSELMNPDLADLTSTADLANALGLGRRCNTHLCLVGAAPFDRGSFDVITSISVVEHIPEDKQEVHKIWNLLKAGGRLLLTVPCAAEAREEYIDRNEYGLLRPNEDGFFFFQRYYDQKLLSENIFSITGQPSRHAIYGEKTAGIYDRNQHSKRSDPNYPVWREPYMMGQEYRYFDTVNELPGVGVIAMEFVKTG